MNEKDDFLFNDEVTNEQPKKSVQSVEESLNSLINENMEEDFIPVVDEATSQPIQESMEISDVQNEKEITKKPKIIDTINLGASLAGAKKSITDRYGQLVDGVKMKTKQKKNNSTSDSKSKKEPKQKTKKKFKLRLWHIILLAIIILGLGFIALMYTLSKNDGPVTGTRCDGLIPVETTATKVVEDQYKDHEQVKSIDILIDCRIIKITMELDSKITKKETSALTNEVLLALDDECGLEKNEDSSYSNLLGNANGKGQYDVEFVLTSKDNENFPAFGTKHPSNDKIALTYASPANPDTTDAVLNPEADDVEEDDVEEDIEE